MNQMLLKAAVGLESARNRAMDRMSNRREEGDIVQTIIIIAMFVLICVVVGGILYDSIFAQANTVGACIASSNAGDCSDFQER